MDSNLTHEDSNFESIKEVDENGREFWRARKLMPLLGYQEWRYFAKVIQKAKISAKKAGELVDNHFGDYTQMVPIGYGNPKAIMDIKLT